MLAGDDGKIKRLPQSIGMKELPDPNRNSSQVWRGQSFGLRQGVFCLFKRSIQRVRWEKFRQ